MNVNPLDPIFYVYVYLDPTKPGNYVYGKYWFNYMPFYIGKGNGDRVYDHLLYGNKCNKHFNRKIKRYKEYGAAILLCPYTKTI